MRIIADLHIHTKYSRATSRDMDLPTIAAWAGLKGIDVVGTGDFTHPAHFAAIEKELEEAEPGLFRLKSGAEPARFMLTAEVSNIFSQGGKVRRIHNLIFAPGIEAARKINKELSSRGNVASDGRPIFGFSAKELLEIVLSSDPSSMLVPAHAWTPWFSIFGSESGFDAIEECFGPLSKHIHAIETGLSSNPEMNRRLSMLDGISLISNSDAHSPAKLGREANVFDCDMDYRAVTGAIKSRDRKKFLFTIEFFPEEGKYHYDGHRACNVSFSPGKTKKAKGICPECGKGLTIGVMSRVEDLADRPVTAKFPEFAVPSRAIVPLEEIIAESIGKGVNTKSVRKEYLGLIERGKNEFAVLLDVPEGELQAITLPKIAEGIMKVRRGELTITPGFDGKFGKIGIFGKTRGGVEKGSPQMKLV